MVLIVENMNGYVASSYDCFRPLAGIMVLIDALLDVVTAVNDYVSVPLRGLWFLSFPYINGYTHWLNLFPSPCGDYGSYLSAWLN